MHFFNRTQFAHSINLTFCILICVLFVMPLLATVPTWAATPATIALGPGAMGEDAIIISGTGSTATLKDVQNYLTTQAQAGVLTETVVNGQHIWTLTKSLLVQKGATLRITGGTAGATEGAQVDWLRLRSDPGTTNMKASNFYTFFVSLRTKDANLLINGVTITSWDAAAGTYDTTYADGRAYVVAKGASRMDITSSNLSYLGSSDGESYGVAWRDTDVDSQGKLRTRATGDVTDSIFSHNYYGIYTFQAGNMSFLRNKMFSNVQYGFDPHDYTHDVRVEDNEAYDNGSHGFIISRGCTNFTFLRNSSHDNKVKAGSKNPSAHGFMLDPGADPATAGVPQAPSTNNVYQDNSAYNNDGYGFRILESNKNTIRHNTFTNNRAGISLEDGSTGNVIDNNTISQSQGFVSNGALTQGYGVQIIGGADANTITNNTINNNAVLGINIKTGKNLIQGNTITGNATNGISIAQETSTTQATDERLPADNYTDPQAPIIATAQLQAITSPNGNQLIGNTVRSNGLKGISVSGASGTVIKDNILETNGTSGNGGSGISITGNTTTTLAQNNTIDGNGSYGIEIYGTSSTQTNKLTRNLITNNALAAISVRNGSNGGITAPVVTLQGAGIVTGKSRPGAVIEVFSDPVDEAAYYEGTTTADSSGAFSFTVSNTTKGSYLTFSATDSAGNTSALSAPLALQQANATTTPTATIAPATPTSTATSTKTMTPTKTATSAATPSPTSTPTHGATVQPVDQPYRVFLPVVQR